MPDHDVTRAPESEYRGPVQRESTGTPVGNFQGARVMPDAGVAQVGERGLASAEVPGSTPGTRSMKLATLAHDVDGNPVARLRCLTPKCGWVGYLRLWRGGPCPRCRGDYAVYA